MIGKTFAELGKRREIYMEVLGDFLKGKAQRIKLSNGYGKIQEDFFKKKIEPKISEMSGCVCQPEFIYTGEIEQRVGKPGDNVMGIDKTGVRGSYEPSYLSGMTIMCHKCEDRMQLIQQEVSLVWWKDKITVSIVPKITCPHCNHKFEISKSEIV